MFQKIAMICAAVTALFAVPVAHAQVTGPIQSLATTQCLDINKNSLAAGAPVIQWGCHGGTNQQWTAVQAGEYVSLKVTSSGMCMDVNGASTAIGAAVIQWNCKVANNQQFTLRPQGGGHALVARHSGLCVSLESATAAQGAQVIQKTCDGSTSQTWRVQSAVNVSKLGRWGAAQTLSMVPVAAANLPNGNVLFWSAYNRFKFGGDNGRTYTSIYNPATGTATEVLVSNTGHDMFCPGIANLPDGRIHVQGGSSAAKTSIYDPVTGTWSASAPMGIPRGYQGSVSLANGDVFTIGGSWSGGNSKKNAEVWSLANGTWRKPTAILDTPILTADAQGIFRSDNHAWLFTASGGRVFHAGPSKQMNWFNPTGAGTVTPAGNRAFDGDAMDGNAVMFDINRILTTGGAPNYQDNNATANAHLINIGGAAVTVKALAPMAYARGFHNSVILPNGKVLVMGGQTYVVPFSDDRAILVPEQFDPQTETFTAMAAQAQARTYHSVALLLPDARVLSGGGGLCDTCLTNHPNVEIYSPTYLFNVDGTAATRPLITAVPTVGTAGANIAVTTNSAITAFSLIRLSSVTHSVNNEQRRVPLTFTTTAANQYSLALPADRGILVPGYYMLFALNGAGVPSVASTIRIP